MPDPTTRGKLFIVSAPSGCGKTTLCNKLLAGGMRLVRSISVTTRPPRPGEKDGVDYRFVSPRRFAAMAGRGAFLEHEENFGNLYGTPRRPIEAALAKGRSVLLSIDVKGAMKVRRHYPKESVLIFIMPPSIAALKKRLRGRAHTSNDRIGIRLRLAKKEMSYRDRYDHTVVNDTLAIAYRRLTKIVSNELESQ